MTNQQLKAHCEDVIANPQDHLDWVVDMAKEALAALTQPASPALKLPDVQEQVIGVWNPSANEIAVRKLSGIKVVDFAHWHCHCTKEVVVRDISDHPAILNATHTAPIEPVCTTGGADWVKCAPETMPHSNQTVQFYVADDKAIKQGRFISGSWHQEQDWCESSYGGMIDSEVCGNITHWMPLPAAPEEK